MDVALPAIAKELGGGIIIQQWVVNAYLITLGALILIAGSLSDMFGRKKILMLGLVGFGITSLLCAVAPTGITLVIARALQGAAGALLVPSFLALIMASFEGAEKSKAIGSWTAWTVIAPALTLESFHQGTLFTAVLFAVGGIVSAIGIKNRRLKPGPEPVPR